MKTIVGVYSNHDKVMWAIRRLNEKGFPIAKLFIISPEGKEVVSRRMRTSRRKEITVEGVLTGILLGAIAGVLIGTGVIFVPGFGELYNSGPFIGGLAGANIGLFGGGIVTVLVNYTIREKLAEKYERELQRGDNLLLASGTQQEIELAQNILDNQEEQAYADTYCGIAPAELYEPLSAE